MEHTKICLQCAKEFTFEIGGPITPDHRKYCGEECKSIVIKASARAYYERNKEKVKESATQWAKDNPEERKVSVRKSRRKHVVARRANQNAWRHSRPEAEVKRRQKTAEWKKEHLANGRATENKRRTMKTQAGGYFTAEEWFLLCFSVGFKCLRCRQVKPLTADHVLPVSMGGTSWLHNIQPLCKSCNSSKHDKHIDYRVNLGEEQTDGYGPRCCTSPEFYSI